MRFVDRVDAGRQLVDKLSSLKGESGLLVLGIPRGGVVVAYEVALALGAPLDVALSRKLGAPQNEELAIGALAEEGSGILEEVLIQHLRVPPDYIERVTQQEMKEIERRAAMYRGRRPPVDVRGRSVVVVDDGVATGATMIVTLEALRDQGVRKLIAAAPVMSGEAIGRLRWIADEIVTLHVPSIFLAVGGYYQNFDQVSDAEVRELLADLAGTQSQ